MGRDVGETNRREETVQFWPCYFAMLFCQGPVANTDPNQTLQGVLPVCGCALDEEFVERIVSQKMGSAGLDVVENHGLWFHDTYFS